MARFRLPPRTLVGLALTAASVVWVLSLTPPLRQAEAWALDMRLGLLSPPSPAVDQIVLVGMDERVLAELPYRSPLDRGFLADLVAAVLAARPRAVGIDLLFDQPTEAAKDARLHRLLHEAEIPVVIAWADRADGLTPAQAAWIEEFTDSLIRGAAILHADAFDGRVRHVAARWPGGEPGLAGALYAASQGRAPPAEPFLLAPTRAAAGSPFRTLPAGVVAGDGAAVRPWLEDRIVLIGAILPGEDRHAVAHGVTERDLPGVEIHAHILARLLDGWQPRPLPQMAEPLLLLAAAAIGVLLVALRMSTAMRVALGLGMAVVAGVTLLLLTTAQIVTPVVTPVQAAVFAIAGTRLRIAAEDRARRRFLHQAFGRYIPPALVDRLVAHPEELRLSGERREITAMFTDLEGFTALTEAVPAETLVAVLNSYLDGICGIIVKHGGTVDKLVGDAVVAFFNAPLDVQGYPCLAVRTALEIDAFAKVFARSQDERLGRRLGMTRIGIATGTVTVGNFGGDVLFDYTAQGPAMNLAARLEGANRELGTTICVDETTAASCPEYSFRALGTVRAKGFAEPVAIFTPVDATEAESHAQHASTVA
jgi:adenylate cyclase